MEKEITENLIEIMKAYLKGEVIEERVVILGNRTSSWSIHVGNDWNTAKYEYRIKPKPQYRPFNDIEECWQEMQKHQPFGWVKIHGIYYNINEVDGIDKKLYIGTYYYTLESAYADITFADGKPFGVKTTAEINACGGEAFVKESKLRTYISTITHMTEKDYKEIQDFYLKFVIKYFLHQLNKTK